MAAYLRAHIGGANSPPEITQQMHMLIIERKYENTVQYLLKKILTYFVTNIISNSGRVFCHFATLEALVSVEALKLEGVSSSQSGKGKAGGRRSKQELGKREKFRVLAEGRTNNALVAIGRIGNLSNRQLYEFEDAEVRKVIKALKEAVSEVENRFASPKGKSNDRFKL